MELHNSYRSSSKSFGVSAGATVGYGHKLQMTGNGGSISAGRSNLNTDETIHHNGSFTNVDKRDRKNAAAFFEVEGGRIKAKPITGIPTAIELTPVEWKKLPNLAQIGTLYADGVLVEFMLGKDNSEQYCDQYGNGQYALQITVKAYWDFLRLHVQEEFGKPGYREALDKELRLRSKERKQMEDKARAEGFEIDESYQDPPASPLVALPRDGSR